MAIFLNKYYKTKSSYHLRKLRMMFRVEVKKRPSEGFMCGFNFSLLCGISATCLGFTFICWFVNETPLLKQPYHP